MFPNEILFKILSFGARNLAYCNLVLYNESIKLYGHCSDCNCINFPQLFGIRCTCSEFGKCMKCINKIIYNNKTIKKNYQAYDHNLIINVVDQYDLNICYLCKNIVCEDCLKKIHVDIIGNYLFAYVCNNCYNSQENKEKFKCNIQKCRNIGEYICNYNNYKCEYINKGSLFAEKIGCNNLFCKDHIKYYDSSKKISICKKCNKNRK